MTADNEGLEPCPFCGGDKAMATYVRDGKRVHCPCGASGASAFHGLDTIPTAEQRAIAAWNRRARPPVGEELRERVARIVDPAAWEEIDAADAVVKHPLTVTDDEIARAANLRDDMIQDEEREAEENGGGSFRKADAIIDLILSALPQREAVAWRTASIKDGVAIAEQVYASPITGGGEGLAQPGGAGEWRCFHCGETFTDPDAAALHFGKFEDTRPACKIGVEQFRKMEDELASWRTESDPSSRAFYALGADHRTALVRAEEEGYARGLADALPAAPDTTGETS